MATSPVSLYPPPPFRTDLALALCGNCLLYYNGLEITLFLFYIQVALNVTVMFHAQRLAPLLLI
jgi:hypothetical protein